jgi:hypothetical protein
MKASNCGKYRACPVVRTYVQIFHIPLCLIVLLFLGSLSAESQSNVGSNKQIGIGLSFRMGKSDLDVNYLNNKVVLDTFVTHLKQILSDSCYTVKQFKLVGSASPDGKSESVNIQLAGRRAESIQKYLAALVNVPPSTITIENKGENWDVLRVLVENSKLSSRRDLLRILNNVHDRNKRKNALIRFHRSAPYIYMRKHYFPILSGGIYPVEKQPLGCGVIVDFDKRVIPPPVKKPDPKPIPKPVKVDTIPASSKPKKDLIHMVHDVKSEIVPLGWTVGTNLAYIGVLMPNIELQGALSNHFSLNINGMCAWWSQSSKQRYYQMAGGSAEFRYWTAGKVLKGQYVGIMLIGGLYDLENRGNGYQGEYGGAGITYGYVLPLSHCLSLDLGLGGGFLSTQYRKYDYENSRYTYLLTKKCQYLAPLKLEIGLVWRIAGDKIKK